MKEQDSQTAFRDFYDMTYDRLFRIAYYYVKQEEWSQEIVLDVFLRLWKQRDTLLDVRNIEDYCFILVKNASLNYLEKESKYTTVHSSCLPEPQEQSCSPEETLITEELFALYVKALDRLPERCREVFIRIREEHQSYAQVAEDFPYYSYMQGFWEGMGLRTTMNTRVTLSDLRRMNKYDLCILSAHGAYYTYSYGTFRKHTRTEPIILLTEASTLYKDIIYGFDLLAHRIIKLNGLYCVTADFFRNAYRSGQLSNTIIYSETCEFLGVTNSVDESMAEALLAGGARTVLGYVNNVYTVYSRSMLWDTVNHLAMGQTIGRALAHAKDTYGENDIIWYTEQGGRRPHAAAAYLVLYGDENARLNVPENFSLEERAEAAEDMLADVLESAA